MDVGDAGFALAEVHDAVVGDGLPGIGGVGERVLGDAVQVAGGNEVFEGLGSFVFILRVLVDGGAQGVEVFLQNRFLGVHHVDVVGGHGNRKKNGDYGNHDDQLNQREAALPVMTHFALSSHLPVLVVGAVECFTG
jgi:hypothetical protein